MARRFVVATEYKGVDKTTRVVNRITNSVRKLGAVGERTMNRVRRATRGWKKDLRKLKFVGIAAVGGLGFAMLDVIRTGAKFEQMLVNAAVKFPKRIKQGTKAFEELKQAAKDVGRTTEFTASQTAEALNFLAMAGFTAQQAVASLPGVVDLATVAQVDLQRATDIATDSLGAFGLMSKDSTQLALNLAKVNDTIVKTTNSANTSIEELFETFKEGAPIGVTAGETMAMFSAMAGELANAGIKGTRAGTTLKNMFVSLSAKTPIAAKTMRRLRVSTEDAEGNLRPMASIIDDLNKGLSKLGTAQKGAVLKNIFGKIPLAGVNILLKTGTKRLKEFGAEIANATGESKALADIMRQTTLGKLKALQSAIEGVKLEIFDMIQGPLMRVIEGTTKWIRENDKLIVSSLRVLFNIIKKLTSWFFQFGAGLGIVVAKVVLWVKGMDDRFFAGLERIKGLFTKFKDFVLSTFDSIMEATKTFFVNLGTTIEDLNPLKDIGSDLGKFIFELTKDDSKRNVAPLSSSIVSPQEIISKNIQQSTSKAEVTIKDQTGKAELTGGNLGNGITLQTSGAF